MTDDRMPRVPTIIPRALFLLWAFCTLGLALNSPTSLTAVLAARSGHIGQLSALIFAVSFLTLLADVVVNDLLPARFRLKTARDYRWLFVSLMAIVYWLFGTIALLPGNAPQGAWVLIVSYFGIGAWGMWFAFYTKIARYATQVAMHEQPELS